MDKLIKKIEDFTTGSKVGDMLLGFFGPFIISWIFLFLMALLNLSEYTFFLIEIFYVILPLIFLILVIFLLLHINKNITKGFIILLILYMVIPILLFGSCILMLN